MNSRPIRIGEDDVNQDSTEYHAKSGAPHSSIEGEFTRLELERKPSLSLAAQIERDLRIEQLTDDLAVKSALLEQVEMNAAEAAKRAGLELREHADRLHMQTSLVEQKDAELMGMQAKLDELAVSRDQQVGQYEMELTNVHAKLEVKESELEAVRLRLRDAEKGWTSLKESVVSRDQQLGQYEKELTNMRAELEAKESELEAVRLRLSVAEMDLTKSIAVADVLRAQNATSSVNRSDDQVNGRLLERMRALEAGMASKCLNEKSIEEMECRNEG